MNGAWLPLVIAAGVATLAAAAQGQAPLRYTLEITPVPHGYVTATGIDCGAGRTDCTESFLPSDVVELQAVPLAGYFFLGWKGTTCIGGSRATVAMSYHRWCTAVFAANPGSGLPESHNFSERALLLDTELTGVSSPLPPGSKNRQVYLPDAAQVSVGFMGQFDRPDALRVQVTDGIGFWSVTFAPPSGQSLSVGSYDFISGEWLSDAGAVTFGGTGVLGCGQLADEPGERDSVVPSRFVIHELDVSGGEVQRFAADFEMYCGPSVGIAGAVRYRATRATLVPFDGNYPVYRLRVDPTIGGAVTAARVDCGARRPGPCVVPYGSPAVVTVTAEPSAGYRFMGWGGSCRSTDPTTQVSVDRERKCFAAFYPTGTAPTDPALTPAVWFMELHRADGGPPLREFKWSETADLVAFNGGFSGYPSVSAGWSNWHDSGAPRGQRLRRALFIVPAGVGPGDYTEVYSGTNGRNPALEMSDETTVRRDPRPQLATVCVPRVARVRVYEWTMDTDGRLVSFAADFEALCTGAFTYMVGVVRFNSSRTSLEPFDGDNPLYRLVIERSPNGRVAAAGIDCGAGPHTDCAEAFATATDVTLQALPGAGYEFAGWTGACKGAATTSVRVDWTRTCSAVFTPIVPGFGVQDPRARNAFLVDGAAGNTIVTGRHFFTEHAVYKPQPNSVHPTWVIMDAFAPGGRWWTVQLRVPHDQVLRPGTYDARLFGGNPSAEPQMSVQWFNTPDFTSARCGPGLIGRFVIHEISFATVGTTLTLTSLAVDFEQRCSPGAPPLRGFLRYNSTYTRLKEFATVPAPAPSPTGDVDADGWPDLVWRHATSGRNAVWLMTGADVKATHLLMPASAATVSDANWQIRAVADFNGDARADLVWQHATSGKFAVWFMSGASRVSTSGFLTLSGTSEEPDTDWRIVGAGDFNRDTQTDLLWRHQVSGALRLWHMNGLEHWDSVALPVVADTDWEIAGVADVNQDGWVDLVWRHYDNGGLAAWLMRDTALVETPRLAPASSPDTDWRIVGAADMDRDGHVDLVWQHRTDGRLGIWYMTGLERTRTSLLGPGVVSDPGWHVVGVR